MSQQPGRSSSAAAIRGLLLVLVAAAIGVLLLRSSNGDDETVTTPDQTQQPGATVPTATSSTTLPGNSTATTVPVTIPTTTAPSTSDNTIEGFQPRSPSEVSVQVSNSTSVRGAAGRITDRLKGLGFITLTPTDLRGTPLDRTRVHYQPGSLLEAQNIAEVLGLDRQNDVFKMFEDLSAISAYEMPEVFLAVGTDLAS